MTREELFLTVIKEEIKTRQDIFKDYKVTKIIHISEKPIYETKCYGDKTLYQYLVTTDRKAKKYENNRTEWKMNVYSDGTIISFYEREYYES